MSWSDIRTATKLKLESVAGVVNVKDFVIWTDDWNFIITTFGSTDSAGDGILHTWMIGFAGNPANRLNDSNKENDYLLNIVGYYSIQTNLESSKTFEDLVVSIRDEFMKSFSYVKNFVPGYTDSSTTNPPQGITIENTVWNQQPVHRALIQIPITEIVLQDLACNG